MISSINGKIHNAADTAKDWSDFNKTLNLNDGVSDKKDSLNMELGETILHLAIRINDATILRRIVIKYPDESKHLFDVSYNNHTPISLAAEHKRFSAIRFLIDHDDKIDTIRNNKFKKSYSLAVEEDSENSVQNPYLFTPAVILEGGGAKGIIYNGMVQALEEEDILPYVERVAGASAGAITATLLAIGCTAVEFNNIIENTPGSLFNDKGWTSNGYHSGQQFLKWIEKKIYRKTGIKHCTFGELADLVKDGKPFKHLKIFGTKVSNLSVKIAFDSEDPDCAEIIISDAVRISMAIPVYFATHPIIRKQIISGTATYLTQTGIHSTHYKKISEFARDHERQYTDGGLGFGNLPIDTYDTDDFNGRVLGFSLTAGSIKKTVSTTAIPKVPMVSPKDCVRVAKLADVSIPLHKAKKNYPEKKTSCLYPITVGFPAFCRHYGVCTPPNLKNFKNHPINADRVVKLSSCGIKSADFNTSPFESLGQKGMKEGYISTIEYLREHWEKISPHFSTIFIKNVTCKNTHQFMLVKPVKDITPSSFTQFKTLRSLNPELKLLDILETSKYLLGKNKDVRRYITDFPHFYLNPHVQKELAPILAAQSNSGEFNFLITVITNTDDVSSYFSKSASSSSTESEEENESSGSLCRGSTDSSETESEDEDPFRGLSVDMTVDMNFPDSPFENAKKAIPASSSTHQKKDLHLSTGIQIDPANKQFEIRSAQSDDNTSKDEDPFRGFSVDMSVGMNFPVYPFKNANKAIPTSSSRNKDSSCSAAIQNPDLSNKKFQIFVRTYSGDCKTLSIDTCMNDSFINVVQKIEEKIDVPAAFLSLRGSIMGELNPFHRRYSGGFGFPVTLRDYPCIADSTFRLDVLP